MRRLVPVAVALLLASCAPAPSPDVTREQPQPASELAEPSPIVVSSSSPAAIAAPSDQVHPAFPLGERLEGAQADFDCDGRADQLDFYPIAGSAPIGLNRLARLTLASGAVRDLALSGMEGVSPLIGIADVNGDGCDDAIVTLGHGASTTWTTFVVYDGNDLRQAEEEGKPVMFLFGGSVRHGNAIECRRTKDAPEIVVRAVSDYTTELQWDTVEDVHHWSTKSHLVLWSTSRSVIPVSVPYAMPPDTARYWGISCGAVKMDQ